MTRASESVVSDVCTDVCIFDHSAVHFRVRTAKPLVPRESRSTRCYKEINRDCFRVDLQDSGLLGGYSHDLDGLVERSDSTLKRLVNSHAPVRSRVIAVRRRVPWYTGAVREAKCKRRQLERSGDPPNSLFIARCLRRSAKW